METVDNASEAAGGQPDHDGRAAEAARWTTDRIEAAAPSPGGRATRAERSGNDHASIAAADCAVRHDAMRIEAPGGSAAIVGGEEYAVAMRSRPLPGWVGPFYLIAGFGLLPWSVGLAITLPATAKTTHYGAAWFGFDLLLGALLIRTGWLAVRRRHNIELTAAATATMLIVDAWFDTMTADTHDQFVLALVLAFCAELPLAGLCLYIAGSVELQRQRQQIASHRLVRQLVTTLERARRAAATAPMPPMPPNRADRVDRDGCPEG